MEIKVLGTGCASCKALYTAVIQAVSETGIEAKVVKVEELTEIMKYNVMSMPALVIDGKVVSSGRKPTVVCKSLERWAGTAKQYDRICFFEGNKRSRRI